MAENTGQWSSHQSAIKRENGMIHESLKLNYTILFNILYKLLTQLLHLLTF